MTSRLLRLSALSLLLPALLAAGVGHGYAAYRCRLDRVARATCCCPGGDDDAGSDGQAHLAKACCCDRVLVSFSVPAAHPEDHASPAPAGLTTPRLVLPATRSLAVTMPRRVSPAGLGPPLLLLKSSLLV